MLRGRSLASCWAITFAHVHGHGKGEADEIPCMHMGAPALTTACSVQELPAHMWTLLGAPAHELKLKMLTISLSSDADLAALRQHVAGIVEYIQHGNLDSGLSASF